jgi:PRC-barrel domain
LLTKQEIIYGRRPVMSGRILMTTVAALALTLPAVAQDQPKPPLDTGQEAAQPLQHEDQMQEQGAPAGAATDQGVTGAQPPMTAENPAAQQEEATTPPPDIAFLEVQDEAQFLANDEVIGKEVVNPMDEEVGEIADLVMDRDQKLVGVVLSVGGFLGLGEKWVAVPVDTVQFPTDDQPARLLVVVTKEQLENAPDFVTRDAVEAQAALDDTQRQAMQQRQQIPPPETTSQ